VKLQAPSGDYLGHLRKIARVGLNDDDLLWLIGRAHDYRQRHKEWELILRDEYTKSLQTWERDARRAFVELVYETWRDARRRRKRRARDERRRLPKSFLYNGTDEDCINLIRELLKLVGEEPPSVATLRYDLAALKTGRERKH
jgi:hypothetical protein